MLARVCISLGCNNINPFYPLDNIVKVPTMIRSSTELISWEENAREGENHSCSNFCSPALSVHITQHCGAPPSPSQPVSVEGKDKYLFEYEVAVTKR